MNNIEIKTIQQKIKIYYKKNSRDLPWREKVGENQDPYETLISEIMLQQTRVKTVLKYYRNFLKQFPSIKILAMASEEKVLKAWSGMGYYKRALNLHATAKIILKKNAEKIPAEKKVLLTFPGIGEYTSSAIASFAFGKDELVIDTNVERFVNRIFNISDNNITHYRTKFLAAKVFPKKNKGNFAQAIMDFSNEYCIKLNPKCDVCLISKYCNYTKTKTIKETKIHKNKKYCTSYFIFDERKKFFVRKRPTNKILGGLYEIPSTTWKKIKTSDNQFIKIKDNRNIIYSKTSIKHEFSHFILFSKVIILNKKSIKEFNFQGKWVDKNSLENLPLSKLTLKIVNYSLEELSSLRKFL